MKAKRTRKELLKTHGLYRRGYRLLRRWEMDVDYANSLPPEAKEWLSRFLREYHAADIIKGDPDSLHTGQARRDAFVQGNAARRDTYAILDCQGQLERVGDKSWRLEATTENPLGYEDALIEALDDWRKARGPKGSK